MSAYRHIHRTEPFALHVGNQLIGLQRMNSGHINDQRFTGKFHKRLARQTKRNEPDRRSGAW